MLLAQRLGLSEFERQTLLLCAAMELDTRIASLCARRKRDPARPYPTFALALTLFDRRPGTCCRRSGRCATGGSSKSTSPARSRWSTSALKADERIVNYIKGLNYLDDRLAPLLTRHHARSRAAAAVAAWRGGRH